MARATIGGQLVLDKRGFVRVLNSAIGDAKKGMSDLGGIGGSMRFTGAADFYSGLKLIGDSAAAAKDSVKTLFNAGVVRDDLFRMLSSTSDGARSVEEQFERLQQRALETGVGVNEMAQAFAQLRGASLSSADAEVTAAAVANALNRVGKAGDFVAVMANMIQISTRVSGLGDEIKETAAYLPEVRKLSLLKFGADTGEGLNAKGITGMQWVKGITEELAKYEKAAGGARQVTNQMSSAWQDAQAFGGRVITGMVEKSPDWLNWMKEKAWQLNDEIRANSGIEIAGTIGDAGRFMYDKVKQLSGAEPGFAPALTEEQLAQKRQEAAETQRLMEESRARSAEEIIKRAQDLLDLENEVAQVEKSGDEEAILAARLKLALAKDLQNIMRATGATEERATEAIKQQITAKRDLENIQKRLSAKDQAQVAEDLQISTLRARGRDRQADKLQADVTERRRTQDLQNGGFDAVTAKQIAEQERKNREDQEYFDRTGRRRIRGAKSNQESTGLDDPFKYERIILNQFKPTGSVGGYDRSQPMARLKSRQETNGEQFSHASLKKGKYEEGNQFSNRTLEQKLDQLIAAVKENKPPVSTRVAGVKGS